MDQGPSTTTLQQTTPRKPLKSGQPKMAKPGSKSTSAAGTLRKPSESGTASAEKKKKLKVDSSPKNKTILPSSSRKYKKDIVRIKKTIAELEAAIVVLTEALGEKKRAISLPKKQLRDLKMQNLSNLRKTILKRDILQSSFHMIPFCFFA